MLAEVSPVELSAALDASVAELLDATGICDPPVDALDVATRRGFIIARDDAMQGRARLVQLARHVQLGRPGMILIGREDRDERRQWAVAHELGESIAHQVFAAVGVSPSDAQEGAREQVANWLAGRVLVPTPWLRRIGDEVGWDLSRLKERFVTASFELLARRMLDLPEPSIVITLFDQGKCIWRRGNTNSRPGPLSEIEQNCWQEEHETSRASVRQDERLCLGCWPIHEPDWKREILRVEFTFLE